MTFFNATDENRHLVIYGYIRENCEWNVPILLIKWFIRYYDETYKWKFTGKQLQQLLTDTLWFTHTSFTIKNTLFTAHVYQSSQSRWTTSGTLTEENIHFGFKIQNFARNMESMIVYYELKCLETNTKLISTAIMDKDTYDRQRQWNELPLSACNEYKDKQLTFLYFVKPIQIKYTDKTANFVETFDIPKKCEFVWELTCDELCQLKRWCKMSECPGNRTRDARKFYFPNPNGYNWCIYINKTWGNNWYNSIKEDDYWTLNVQLLGLPPKVDEVGVDITAYFNNCKLRSAITTTKKHKFSYYEDGIDGVLLSNTKLLGMDKLSLKVCLNIRNIVVDDKKVSKVIEMNEYGIIS